MRSRLFSLNLIVVLVGILSACAPVPEATLLRDDEPLSQQPTPQKNDEKQQPFFQALNQANSTTTLAKSAKTEAEWKAVAQQWDKAIALMKSVPKTDKNYAIAQQKISEYQKNLDEAQKKAKTAVSPQNE